MTEIIFFFPIIDGILKRPEDVSRSKVEDEVTVTVERLTLKCMSFWRLFSFECLIVLNLLFGGVIHEKECPVSHNNSNNKYSKNNKSENNNNNNTIALVITAATAIIVNDYFYHCYGNNHIFMFLLVFIVW